MTIRQSRFFKMSDFAERVFSVVRKIPKGKTLSYTEVARRAGFPGAFRAVGRVLKGNHNPLIPCHRVIKSNGDYGGYNRGPKKKVELLRKEGVIK